MVPVQVDPEGEVNVRSKLFKVNFVLPKEFIIEKSLTICCIFLEIWSHFRLTRKYGST